MAFYSCFILCKAQVSLWKSVKRVSPPIFCVCPQVAHELVRLQYVVSTLHPCSVMTVMIFSFIPNQLIETKLLLMGIIKNDKDSK